MPHATPGYSPPAPLPTALDAYRLLGDCGLRVSPLCLGTMTFGEDWGWGADKETSQAMFSRYADAGGNFLDTANIYTNTTSEQYLGEFMKGYAGSGASGGGRDHFVLSTKYTSNALTNPHGGAAADSRPDPNVGGNHRKSMMRAVEDSLKRLQTDYIDLYWLHVWDFTTPVDELMRSFDDLVRQGKILYPAVSDTPAWKISQLQQYAADHALSRFACCQMEYSLVTRDVERELLPMGRELGIGLLPWSPLAGGMISGKYTREDLEKQRRSNDNKTEEGSRGAWLTERKADIAEAVIAVAREAGRSPSQVALNWLLTRPGVPSIIIGARKLEHLEDNLGCLDFTLDDSQLQKLNEVSKIELGFPHEFCNGKDIQSVVFGKATVHRDTPYVGS